MWLNWCSHSSHHVACSRVTRLGIEISLWSNETNQMTRQTLLFLVMAWAETRLWSSVSHSSYSSGSCCCDVIFPQRGRRFYTTTHRWKTTLVQGSMTNHNINSKKKKKQVHDLCINVSRWPSSAVSKEKLSSSETTQLWSRSHSDHQPRPHNNNATDYTYSF